MAASAVALVPAVTVGFEHLIGSGPKTEADIDPVPRHFEGLRFRSPR